MIDENSGCWLWEGARTRDGYGSVRLGARTVLVHRLAAVEWLGFDIESDLCVLHRCDTPRCFNPGHLFFGTNADNVRDRDAKGRANGGRHLGAANASAKLRATDVLEIRRLLSQGKRTYSVAARYDVSESLIRQIRDRRVWTHVL